MQNILFIANKSCDNIAQYWILRFWDSQKSPLWLFLLHLYLYNYIFTLVLHYDKSNYLQKLKQIVYSLPPY